MTDQELTRPVREGSRESAPTTAPDGADRHRTGARTMSGEPTTRLGPDDEATVRVTPSEETVRVTAPVVPPARDGSVPAVPPVPDPSGTGPTDESSGPWQLGLAAIAWWVALGLGILTTTLVLGHGLLMVRSGSGGPQPGDPLVAVVGVVLGLLAVTHWGVQVAATIGLRRGRTAAPIALTVLALLSTLTDIAAFVGVKAVLLVGLCAWHLAVVLAGTVLMHTRPVREHLRRLDPRVPRPGASPDAEPAAGLAPDVALPPDPPAKRPGPLVVIPLVAAAVVLFAVQFLAFVGGSESNQIARTIGPGIAQQSGVSADGADCSWATGAAAFFGGATGHTCQVALDGTTVTAEVTTQNADHFSARTIDTAVIPQLEASLRSLAARENVPVDLTCPRPGGRDVVPAPVGTKITCTGRNAGRPISITATTTDQYGSIQVSSS
jgi:hypothetical protein